MPVQVGRREGRIMLKDALAPDRANDGDIRLWGMSCAQLHKAYWSSHGVACVRLGSGEVPQPGADLYLLLESNQSVVFDLRAIAESLLWNRAHITRLRLVEKASKQYGEFLQLDSRGDITKIERRYRAADCASTQVLLGTRMTDASIWSAAGSSALAFAAMRKGGRLRSDATECVGQQFDLSTQSGRTNLLRNLATVWPHPDHVLSGVTQLRVGVFGVQGTELRATDRCVAPLWLGAVSAEREPLVCVGPDVVWDTTETAVVTMRPIEEIFSPDDAARVSVSIESTGWYVSVKRAADFLISLVVLLVMSPVLLVCCFAVVIDDGFPIFFGHKRQSKGGATFRCWKFRTMRRNAEALVAELRKQNLCDGPQVFIKDDPRVTRVGKVFRKLQLDEFPQFWNVLFGDMSIVGPRPSPDNENQYCPAWREIRLSVRPGITGNWQVKRTRAEGKDFQEWIQYDIEYVEKMGPIFDVWLCILTVVNIVRSLIGAVASKIGFRGRDPRNA